MLEGTPRFIYTNKGKKTLIMSGHKYYKARETNSKERWRCTSNQSKRCIAFVVTLEDKVVCFKNSHSHPPRFYY